MQKLRVVKYRKNQREKKKKDYRKNMMRSERKTYTSEKEEVNKK